MKDDQSPPNTNQQLTQINESILKLGERMDGSISRLDSNIERLDANISALSERMDGNVERLDATILTLYQHMEERFDQLEAKIDTKADRTTVERMEVTLDGIVGRLDTDEQERAAIISEQRRHGQWIGQLAEHTNIKLVPEQ